MVYKLRSELPLQSRRLGFYFSEEEENQQWSRLNIPLVM